MKNEKWKMKNEKWKMKNEKWKKKNTKIIYGSLKYGFTVKELFLFIKFIIINFIC
jgi:hypothetical protein